MFTVGLQVHLELRLVCLVSSIVILTLSQRKAENRDKWYNMVTLNIDAGSFYKLNKGINSPTPTENLCLRLATVGVGLFVSLGLSMRDKPATIAEKRWRVIRANILFRDKKECQRCGTKSKAGRGLTIHHIVPRSEGGSVHGSNLVTLCHVCHDTVEMKGYRTYAEVITTDEPIKYYDEELEDFVAKAIDLDRPIWHNWVYGGKRRPTQI